MSTTVIRVENVSKQYRLGTIGTGTISSDLKRWFYKVRGKEDPFLKIGEENDRSKKGSSEFVWALKDITFDVQRGDVVGVIGKNGAGKSTLLKLLSRTTLPTTGNIKVRGRIASLLEVGTGFHPELTGRENIYLNGAILGMRKAEIQSKFDEIVDFAGVDRYIDTPVKRYSSGMYVRLAFGVAAHLEPEILIVDEVLAVGDAEFQQKALGKMQNVSQKEGRTVLFVSHNMAAIRQLCKNAILLKNGSVEMTGGVTEVTDRYRYINESVSVNISDFRNRQGNGDCRVAGINLGTENQFGLTTFKLGDTIAFELNVIKFASTELKKIRLIIGVYNSVNEGYLRFDSKNSNDRIRINDGQTVIRCELTEHINIKPDSYYVNVAIFNDDLLCDYISNAVKFTVDNFDYFGTGRDIDNAELSKVFYKHSWKIIS